MGLAAEFFLIFVLLQEDWFLVTMEKPNTWPLGLFASHFSANRVFSEPVTAGFLTDFKLLLPKHSLSLIDSGVH